MKTKRKVESIGPMRYEHIYVGRAIFEGNEGNLNDFKLENNLKKNKWKI